MESRKKDCSKSSNWELNIGSLASSRDANVNMETDQLNAPLGRICPGAWKHQSRIGYAKKGTDGDGEALDPRRPNAGKRHSSEGNVNKERVGWGEAPEKIGPDAWKCHSRKGNVNTAIVKIDSDSSNCQSSDRLVNRDADGRDEAFEQIGPHAWKRHREYDTVKGEANGWKHHKKNANVKREADGWGRPLDQAVLDAWKLHKKDDNVERETGGCGRASDESGPDASKQRNGDVNANKRMEGWCSSSDAWERHSKDGEVKKETGGWGVAVKQAGDAWEHHSRDGNTSKETGGWGAAVKQVGSVSWEHHSKDGNVKKEVIGSGVAHNQNSWASWNCDGRDGSAKKETDGLVKANPGPWKQHSGDDNANSPALERTGTDPWEHHIRDDNSKKETNVWDAAVKQAGHHSKDAKVNKESDGWGSALDQSGTDAWNRPTRDGNINKEMDGWGKALDLRGPDAWKRHRQDGNVQRDTDGWAKAFDQTGHDGWSRSHRNRSKSPPFGSKHGSESWDNRGRMGTGPVRACKDFAAGRCSRGSRCRFVHDDNGLSHGEGGATDIWESRPEKVRDSGSELHGANRSNGVCFQFLKGRCYRGGECRYVHHDGAATNGGSLMKDDSKERALDRTDADASFGQRLELRSSLGHKDCKFSRLGVPSGHDARWGGNKVTDTASAWNVPQWGDQTHKMNPSNSSQSTTEKNARVAATSAPAPCIWPNKDYDLMSDSTKPQTSLKGFTGLSASGPQDGHTNRNIDSTERHQHGTKKTNQIELGVAKTGTAPSKEEQAGHSTTADVRTDEESNRASDQRVRKFKFVLVEFVKEILKPSWQEGHLSKEAHILIVKKAVDKVIGALQGPNIPQTQEQIDLYLSYSRTKLNNLVQAYLERYVVRTEHMGEKA